MIIFPVVANCGFLLFKYFFAIYIHSFAHYSYLKIKIKKYLLKKEPIFANRKEAYFTGIIELFTGKKVTGILIKTTGNF